ncbi:gluconate permease GntP [Gilliamella apis]|uniref:Gluconate permease n=1 Tax=Gilliamella apis TaxID=1970738 RepID=A0A242NVG8_9GAMM|nr:gluconate permease GntP [Gilliamella apis]MCT6885384.1 gluconate permease GntP [Gilliamella apis]OTQ36816.1 gluconate permease [Gilliamella apis]OTQ38768.1 gluconate permease [Gilliamella apis]OTQ40538.1 gluconate permease [Gilliamella apis]OTQ43582.1 gluconate permease [Gilliamella apis]
MEFLNILWVILGIGLMLLLNIRFKINSMIALLAAAIFVGLMAKMDLLTILKTIKTGFGGTLGELAIIVVFGAVIGKLMVDSGAAHQIAQTLLRRLGIKYVKLAIIIMGLIFGLAMFYEAAFIILAPLVIALAHEAKIPFLKLAIPGVAAATTAHSLFPPQPGPVALVNAYGADMGMVYIYGLIVAIPSVIFAGLILPKFLGNLERPIPQFLQSEDPIDENNLPSFFTSITIPLIPAYIMIATTVANIWLEKGTTLYSIFNFLGSSQIAMFIAMITAFIFFGKKLNHSMEWVMHSFDNAVKGIAMVVLIIGAGGALKQIIIDTGIGDNIGQLMSTGGVSPYIMAWLITVLIRLATGQGVVSAMTAAGIIGAAVIDPSTGVMHDVNPALLVLATAAGSNTLTHINDASFWLFKGYFDLSIKDTLKTWGLLELVNSIVGLIVVLIISLIA